MRCPPLKALPAVPKDKTGWPWTVGSEPLPGRMASGVPWPKITIVTPSFNQGQFIEETIRSVLLQGYPNLEYIIMDGGSTDGTVDIIQAYEPWVTFWMSEKDGGQSDAINRGWEKGSGDIYAWINSDDTYRPGALHMVGQIFGSDVETVLLSGAGNATDITGTKILSVAPPSTINPYRMIAWRHAIPSQPSVFIHKRVLKEVGYLNTNLYHVMDLDYWIRIGLYYTPDRLKTTDTVLSNYRSWPDTKTSKGLERPIREVRGILDALYARYPHDKRLLNAKKYAYSAMYHAHAVRARDQVATLLAVKTLCKAWFLAPSKYKLLEELLFLLSVLFGRRKRMDVTKSLSHLFRTVS